jgi:hypothetical protein
MVRARLSAEDQHHEQIVRPKQAASLVGEAS